MSKTTNEILHENQGSAILTIVWLLVSFLAWAPFTPTLDMYFQVGCIAIVAFACIEVFVIIIYGNELNLPTEPIPLRIRVGFVFANLICVVFTMADGRFVEGGIAIFAMIAHELQESKILQKFIRVPEHG